eukprot:5457273-Amphidinium_carterae.1
MPLAEARMAEPSCHRWRQPLFSVPGQRQMSSPAQSHHCTMSLFNAGPMPRLHLSKAFGGMCQISLAQALRASAIHLACNGWWLAQQWRRHEGAYVLNARPVQRR